ncbi:MAG: YggT family protein [Dehalococcoidia bacterium]|nr:YggT family protein [Dehalococcoidia bacterium]
MDFVITFINVLVWVLIAGIFARVLLSWIPMGDGSQLNPLIAIVYQITEPILAPLRRIIPRIGIFDLTPTIAIIILFVILNVINGLN